MSINHKCITCTNACRWQYQATPATENELGEIVRVVEPTLGQGSPTAQAFVLEEAGRPGEEIFLAFRNVGGNGLFYKKDRLYLQFRKGRLAGWKGDWSRGSPKWTYDRKQELGLDKETPEWSDFMNLLPKFLLPWKV